MRQDEDESMSPTHRKMRQHYDGEVSGAYASRPLATDRVDMAATAEAAA